MLELMADEKDDDVPEQVADEKDCGRVLKVIKK